MFTTGPPHEEPSWFFGALGCCGWFRIVLRSTCHEVLLSADDCFSYCGVLPCARWVLQVLRVCPRNLRVSLRHQGVRSGQHNTTTSFAFTMACTVVTLGVRTPFSCRTSRYTKCLLRAAKWEVPGTRIHIHRTGCRVRPSPVGGHGRLIHSVRMQHDIRTVTR